MTRYHKTLLIVVGIILFLACYVEAMTLFRP
jgi:hypothetical protein